MKKRKYYNNPKDLINETYNADAFKVIEKTINPLVMPLDMVKDIDALDSKHFYQEEWDKIIGGINKQH
ncbi:hypothetical protein KQI88_16455 [Alkaliphilus sp. MSJ-5]|uniref:Uncharacterized protein n=1 Tax=Alkaliphilus flagellatus TaxID=2841507 RepID=A0ABS6G6A7_9FIRM|nr:hypothetical protein [Alkaliphilus flagellatus]MBU5678012.1 hypothetical protein [Alkaliphilus flagellatus]